jgi:hypothetical protein
MEAELPKSSTFVVTDAIPMSYMGWLRTDYRQSFDWAVVVSGLADEYSLTDEEQVFITVALNHPPLV